MANNLENVFSLLNGISGTLSQIDNINNRQITSWEAVQQQISATTIKLESQGLTISSLNRQTNAMHSQSEWIPAGTTLRIGEASEAVAELDTEVSDLSSTVQSGSMLGKFLAPLKGAANMLTSVFAPLKLLSFGTQDLTAYLNESSEAYKIRSEETTKLAQVMRGSMGATDAEINSINELITAQQNLGVVNQSVMTSGIQELSSHLTKKESLESMIPIMNDVIAQQHGLNATSEQAANISSKLGEALGGQVGVLAEYGYKFDEAQAKTLKYGSESQRVATLMDIVAESAQGVNAALANTPEGRLKKVENEAQTVKESVGSLVGYFQLAFVTASESLMAAFSGVISWFQQHKETIFSILSVINDVLTTAIAGVVEVASVAYDVISWLFDLFKSGNPIIAAVVLALGAYVIGISAALLVTKTQALYTFIVTGALWAKVQAWWALNKAMYANPIGLIIAGIIFLVALIASAIYYFDTWGSSILFLMGPIGWLVNSIIMLGRHWDSIVEAFQSDGILAGINRIGEVLLDTVMHPLEKVLGWVAELTGWDWAKNAVGSVEDFRKSLDLVTAVESEKKPGLLDSISGILGTNDIGIADPPKPTGQTSGNSTTNGVNNETGTSTNSGIANGGTKNNNITINLKDLIGVLNISGYDKKSGEKMTSEVGDQLLRLLAMATTAGN